jgi:N-acetylneuraminate synthase
MTGPDSVFSLEPKEFETLVEAVRTTEKALGEVKFGTSDSESDSRIFRRSLFVVQDMKKGQMFTEETIRSIRPGYGLKPKYLDTILGRYATTEIKTGTPLTWDLVGGNPK